MKIMFDHTYSYHKAYKQQKRFRLNWLSNNIFYTSSIYDNRNDK